MFLIGLLCGMLVVLILALWLYLGLASVAPSSYRARAAARDLERQTIHDLLAAEFAMQRPAGADIIEGTAVEVRHD